MRLLVQHCAVLRRALPDVAGMVTEHLLVASHRCQTPAGVRGAKPRTIWRHYGRIVERPELEARRNYLPSARQDEVMTRYHEKRSNQSTMTDCWSPGRAILHDATLATKY